MKTTKEERAAMLNRALYVESGAGGVGDDERCAADVRALLDDLDEMDRDANCGAEEDDDGNRRCLLRGRICHRCLLAGVVKERATAQAQVRSLRALATEPMGRRRWRLKAEAAESGLAKATEELARLRLELAAQQEEGRTLRAQQHLDAGRIFVPPVAPASIIPECSPDCLTNHPPIPGKLGAICTCGAIANPKGA